jgi:hypothetical protein
LWVEALYGEGHALLHESPEDEVATEIHGGNPSEENYIADETFRPRCRFIFFETYAADLVLKPCDAQDSE